MKTLAPEITGNILSLLESGHSAHKVATLTGVEYKTVSRLHSKHLLHLPKPSGSQPSKLTPTDMHHATCLIYSGKANTAVDVVKVLHNINNMPLSGQTMCWHLKKQGLKAVVKQKRPLLKVATRRDRLDWAYKHKNWTVEDWKRAIWSDETKINRRGSDGRKWVWKKAGEGLNNRTVQQTQKFGEGSVMIWGCMTWNEPGLMCHIKGRMNGELYVEILEDNLQGTLRYHKKKPKNILFQQDNDSKHTCKLAKQWFKKHKIPLMWWHAHSPDLNPIKHLWNHLKQKLGDYKEISKGIHELWERI